METLTTHVWAVYSEYSKEFHLALGEGDMAVYGWVLVKTVNIEAELPPHEVLAPLAAKAMQKEISEIRADAQEKIQKIEAQIQTLLSIEHKA